MPSASLSPSLTPNPNPNPPPAAAASPHNASSGGTMRPPLVRKQSSQSSHASRPHANNMNLASPGSVPEHQLPLRHAVRPGRHVKAVLPRNHNNSARNLTKLNAARPQVQYADDGRKHSRQRSHEGDTEIRLPGSLDESIASKPPMRRNMTAYQLPRNTSHAKLKKNLSHGQLTRLGSGKNLAALNHTAQRAPPSPGLKGKNRRPKSAEFTGAEAEAIGQQEELQRTKRQPYQRKSSSRRVGFAVGSAGDSSDGEGALQMEGSGLQEDEWTEDSASASPYSTRANTANNSRTSVVVDRLNEKLAASNVARMQEQKARDEAKDSQQQSQSKDDDKDKGESKQARDEDEDSEDPPSPLTMVPDSKAPFHNQPDRIERAGNVPSRTQEQAAPPPEPAQQAVLPKPPPPQRSPLHLAKSYTNPTTQRLLDKNQQLPAPALVSNVSALDDTHSSRGSPAPSLRSTRSNIGDGSSEQQEDELVSRFVPSGSHPSTGSGPTTALSTPKQTEFHTPEEDSTLAQQRKEKHFQIGPVSPGSTVSGSSGTTTPAIGRSRTELRMLQEKAIADIESQADQRPHLPKHIFDRRNESLKYYFNANNERGVALAMGPDVFQGRFRALNTELRVVQKFRDPIGEAVARLKSRKGLASTRQATPQSSATLPTSKSAVSLPVARRVAADLSKSASPPKAASLKNAATSVPSAMKPRREVSFANTPPQTREFEVDACASAPDVIAKRLWEAV